MGIAATVGCTASESSPTEGAANDAAVAAPESGNDTLDATGDAADSGRAPAPGDAAAYGPIVEIAADDAGLIVFSGPRSGATMAEYGTLYAGPFGGPLKALGTVSEAFLYYGFSFNSSNVFYATIPNPTPAEVNPIVSLPRDGGPSSIVYASGAGWYPYAADETTLYVATAIDDQNGNVTASSILAVPVTGGPPTTVYTVPEGSGSHRSVFWLRSFQGAIDFAWTVDGLCPCDVAVMQLGASGTATQIATIPQYLDTIWGPNILGASGGSARFSNGDPSVPPSKYDPGSDGNVGILASAVDGGGPTILEQALGPNINRPIVASDDGTNVYYLDPVTGGLERVPYQGGAPTTLAMPPSGDPFVALATTNDWIYFATGSQIYRLAK